MKKQSIILIFFIYFSAQAIPTTPLIWNGVMSSGTANATDQDVQINGNTWLPNEVVTIYAETRNITVTLLNSAHRVYSSDSGQTTLIFKTDNGFKIDIVLDHDLVLAGVQGNITLPLLIEERSSSEGLIRWIIKDDHTLYFGDKDDQDRGGARISVVYSETARVPRHIFKVNEYSDNKTQIRFTNNSSFYFVQETTVAPIGFLQEVLVDASNTDHGTQNIKFKDGSGWFFQLIQS